MGFIINVRDGTAPLPPLHGGVHHFMCFIMCLRTTKVAQVLITDVVHMVRYDAIGPPGYGGDTPHPPHTNTDVVEVGYLVVTQGYTVGVLRKDPRGFSIHQRTTRDAAVVDSDVTGSPARPRLGGEWRTASDTDAAGGVMNRTGVQCDIGRTPFDPYSIPPTVPDAAVGEPYLSEGRENNKPN